MDKKIVKFEKGKTALDVIVEKNNVAATPLHELQKELIDNTAEILEKMTIDLFNQDRYWYKEKEIKISYTKELVTDGEIVCNCNVEKINENKKYRKNHTKRMESVYKLLVEEGKIK